MTDRPWAAGLLAGVLAYLGGFAATAILVIVEDNSAWRRVVSQSGVSEFDLYGWIFYNSHFVGLNAGEPGFFADTLNILSDTPPELPVVAFYAVPIIVLFIGGFSIASEYSEDIASANESAIYGSMIVVGYILLAFAGTLVFSADVSIGYANATTRPDIGFSLVMMGIIYPVLCGSIGGILGYSTKER